MANRSMGSTLALLVILVGIVALAAVTPWSALVQWLLTLVLLFLFIGIAGYAITGSLSGSLIDERNKISLSRFQMLLWTAIVLSAFLTAASRRVVAGVDNALAIGVPETLWLLMGISTTSLVGSPLIKSTKTAKQPQAAQRANTFQLLAAAGVATEQVDSIGQLVVNKTAAAARWSDLFKGEETGDAANMDLAKIQMFFFTIIVALAYAIILGRQFKEGGTFASLPELDTGMIALLGISHAGYLTNKAVPHSAAV